MVLGAICTLCTGELRVSKEHYLEVQPVELREVSVKLVDVVGLEHCPMLKQERFAGRAEQIARLLGLPG